MTRKTVKDGGAVFMSTAKLAAIRQDLERHKKSQAQVGLLGETAQRPQEFGEDQPLTNPEIGIRHEFGSPGEGIPQRSFLRMPLFSKLPAAIEKLGRDAWRKAIFEQGIVMALAQLAVLGEGVVMDAFATGGFGTWKPLSPRTIIFRRNKSNTILVDTAEMRQAVTSRVIDKSP